MAPKSLKILMICDLTIAPPYDGDFSEWLKTEEWEAERHVIKALKSLGHEVKIFGVYKDILPLVHEIQKEKPDLVFNMCEAINDNRDLEPQIVGMLELLGVRYSGAGSWPLRLCKDKGLTKKILTYHKIGVPRFVISRKSNPLRSLKRFHYPAFIKPLGREASEGISQMSLAENEKDCLERVQFLHEKLNEDVIIEEFIDGREVYVGVMGLERLTALPPRELIFKELPEGEPKIFTYRAKWDQAYRKKWGVTTTFMKGSDEALLKKVIETSKKIYRLMEIKSYARIDLRITEAGQIYFLEANPNPSIASSDDFALAAKKAELSYEDLIERILQMAFTA